MDARRRRRRRSNSPGLIAQSGFLRLSFYPTLRSHSLALFPASLFRSLSSSLSRLLPILSGLSFEADRLNLPSSPPLLRVRRSLQIFVARSKKKKAPSGGKDTLALPQFSLNPYIPSLSLFYLPYARSWVAAPSLSAGEEIGRGEIDDDGSDAVRGRAWL